MQYLLDYAWVLDPAGVQGVLFSVVMSGWRPSDIVYVNLIVSAVLFLRKWEVSIGGFQYLPA
eukprot:5644135-Pyramimonas_sp.AAC.1